MRAVTYLGVTILGALLAYFVATAAASAIAGSLNQSAALISASAGR